MKKICVLVGAFSLTLLVGMYGQESDEKWNQSKIERSTELPRVIHPRFRENPVPAQGTLAKTNPPIFQIPLEAGKKSNTYGFRLSQDSLFKNGRVIEAYELPFAIFNPHEKLQKGVWYWHYKYEQSPWSGLLHFEIDERSQDYLTPSPLDLIGQIPDSHPRSIIFQSDLKNFRSRSRDTRDAELIIARAADFLFKDPPNESEGVPTLMGSTKVETQKLALDASKRLGSNVRAGLDPLVKAYLLTNDSSYGESAIRWAREVANWDPNGVSMINNFADSDCMLSLAMVYDACHQILSDADKIRILKSIQIRGNRFYNSWINNLEAKVFSGHVWQHILERLFKTSLATIHDIPEAALWLTYIYEIWQARSPVLGPIDGGWWNGTHYFELNTLTLLEIPLILKDLTGVDFFRSKFYQNNPDWLIYSFPPNSFSEGFGNGTEKQFGQKTGVLAYADALGRLTQNPRAIYYADQHLESMGIDLTDDEEFRWFRLRWKLPDRPASLPKLDIPLAKSFRETRTVNMHTNLADPSKNLMVSLRSSPYGSTSHAHADQNSFNIQYGGERIFYTSGYRPSMGVPHYNEWFKATKGHNSMLIDGLEQPIASSESYGWIARFLHGDRISYALGDASMAYDNIKERPQSAGLKKFRRHLVLLRPNIVVIYDELEADHDAEWSWLLHSIDTTIIDSTGLICKTRLAQTKVDIFGSCPLETDISTVFDPAPVNFRNLRDEDGDLIDYKDQWHITAKSSQKLGKMRYLTIIQIVPISGSVIPQPAPERKADNLWVVGDWTIEAQLDTSQAPQLIIRENADTEALFYGEEKYEFAQDEITGQNTLSTILVQKINGLDHIKEVVDEFPQGRD